MTDDAPATRGLGAAPNGGASSAEFIRYGGRPLFRGRPQVVVGFLMRGDRRRHLPTSLVPREVLVTRPDARRGARLGVIQHRFGVTNRRICPRTSSPRGVAPRGLRGTAQVAFLRSTSQRRTAALASIPRGPVSVTGNPQRLSAPGRTAGSSCTPCLTEPRPRSRPQLRHERRLPVRRLGALEGYWRLGPRLGLARSARRVDRDANTATVSSSTTSGHRQNLRPHRPRPSSTTRARRAFVMSPGDRRPLSPTARTA